MHLRIHFNARRSRQILSQNLSSGTNFQAIPLIQYETLQNHTLFNRSKTEQHQEVALYNPSVIS